MSNRKQFLSKICKELLKLNNKRTDNSIEFKKKKKAKKKLQESLHTKKQVQGQQEPLSHIEAAQSMWGGRTPHRKKKIGFSEKVSCQRVRVDEGRCFCHQVTPRVPHPCSLESLSQTGCYHILLLLPSRAESPEPLWIPPSTAPTPP